MDQVTQPQTINEINAALLAQYKSGQKKAVQGTVPSNGFASELAAIEKKELPAPLPLVKAIAKPASATATQAPESEPEVDPCSEHKISRSDRMACAEKATHVSYEDDDFSFGDFVDFINPLQHIPVLGTIYREITGDAIKPEVQVAGSMVFGLATGSVLLSAASGIASAVIEQETGEEPTVQIANALLGDETVQVPDPAAEQKIVVASTGDVDASRTAEAVETNAPQPNKAAPVTSVATAAVAAVPASSQMSSVAYTSPTLHSAAKVSAAQSPIAAQTAKASLEDKTVGTLIHEQAQARASGQALPPQLVQDMMLKALDKYQAAHATSGTGSQEVLIP